MLIPSATDDFLGSEKFGVRPTAVAPKKTGPWTMGCWPIASGRLPAPAATRDPHHPRVQYIAELALAPPVEIHAINTGSTPAATAL
jgi:hypothetical protein